VLRISVNFRSVPAVLEEANRLVAPLMQGPVEGRYEPEYVPLEPHRAPTGDGPAVHCLYPDPETVFAPGGEEQAGGTASPPMGLLREREAAVLARWIRTAVESGLPVRDRQGGGVRGARYRDVGLLLHAMTNVTMIEDALTAEGIPFRVASGKHYYARDEIGDLLLVLRAIDAPYAPEWVAGALRTPFFGCSDEDLARHASAGGVFLAGEAARSPVAAVREGLEFLHDLHAARARLAPAQVIERLLGGTQAHALYRAKPHGEQRLANLLRVRAFARERAGGPAGTFRSFVDWLARRQAEAVDEGEAPASEPGDDVVQCLTMHRAKGLEFPVVVLAQLGQSRERTDLPPLLDGPRARPAVHVRKGCESLGYPEAQAAHAAREEHENRRLLYVALTRARDHLVLPLHWTSSPDIGVNGYFLEAHPPRDAAEEREEPAGVRGVLLAPPEGPEAPDARAEAVSGVGGVPGAGVAEGDGEGAGDGPLASRRAWEAAHAARAGRLNAGRPVRTASDALEAAARAGAESASDAEPDAAADAEPDRPALRAHEPESPDAARAVETARRFGTLVHALLEEADLPDGTTLEPLSRRLAAESGSDEAERAEALALARSALGTPLLRRAAAAEALAREAPFAAEADGTLLEGFVDLVFLEAGGAVVVDYKTNRVTAAETAAAAERYRPQAAVYARALAEALPVPVREVVFLFLRPGVAESIPVDAALLSEAAAAGPAGAGASL
jgi:ATP-dependent helicase/nuclease subunit A